MNSVGVSAEEIFQGTANAVVDQLGLALNDPNAKKSDDKLLTNFLRVQRRNAAMQVLEYRIRYEVAEYKLLKLKETDAGKKDKEKIASLSAELSNAATAVAEWQIRLKAVIKLTSEFVPMQIISENYGSVDPAEGSTPEKPEEVKE